jgi:endonuclease III
MSEKDIRDRLLSHGIQLFEAKQPFVNFAGRSEADKLTSDLERYPHAFVIACIMDRQVRAEIAWQVPYLIYQKLGDFSFSILANLSLEKIQSLMMNPKPLHRFPERMGLYFFEAIARISSEYQGDAARIWNDEPSSAQLVYRFLQFSGVGPKIATMAANILARDFKVPLRDYYSIDISPDVHIRRVFGRLGLVSENASNEELIYKARALYPEFPGLMDLPSWEIGRKWCKPKRPACGDCYMREFCPTSKTNKQAKKWTSIED